MKKNIYDLMNETTVQLENYEVIKMTKLEQKRAFKNATASHKQKTPAYKKYVATASVAVLCLGTLGAIPTMATTSPTAYKIASLLGIEKNLDDYTTLVNTSVLDKGISMTLGEVLYDKEGDVLIVTNSLSVAEGLLETTDLASHSSLHQRLYINGQELNVSSSTEVQLADPNTLTFITTYNMPEDFENKNDVTLKMRQLFINDTEYRGNWDFSFSMDGTLFNAATQTTSLDETLTGLNGEMNLVKYVKTPLEEGIYYTQENSSFCELRGTDNNGNEVVFVIKGGVYEGLFKLVLAPGYEIKEDATSLTLELYEKPEFPLESPEVTTSEGQTSTQIAHIGENFEATGAVVTITLPS